MEAQTVDTTWRVGAERARPSVALALASALTAFAAASWTLWDHGLLGGPEAMQGSARGTSLVVVALALPVLLASVVVVRRGSQAALVGWAGATLYLVYNAVLLL
ncbi:hypothetical protein YX36_004751, partial [Salmonella enterica subsp. enterica serovar Javiana]|nr:hypothetical protein [Salmonella enterica subsp. enterica serovar Javiana]